MKEIRTYVLILFLVKAFANQMIGQNSMDYLVVCDTTYSTLNPKVHLPSLNWNWKKSKIDSNKTDIIPIGFNFKFNGGTYSKLMVSPQGWLSFDTNITIKPSKNDLKNVRIPNLVTPMWDDTFKVYAGQTLGEYYTTFGKNRVFAFRWKNLYDCPNVRCGINFVMLYENSNKIIFIYEPLHHHDKPRNLSGSIGIIGDTAKTNNFISIEYNNSYRKGVGSNTVSYNNIDSIPLECFYQFFPCDSIAGTKTVYDTLYCNPVRSHPLAKWRKSAGTYYDTIRPAGDCDSIFTYHVYQGKIVTKHTTVYDTSCNKYLTKKGFWLTSSDSIIDTLKTQHGCDSIVTTHVQINRNDTVNVPTIRSCLSYTSPYNVTYNQSGIYFQLVGKNKFGCDSIHRYNIQLFNDNDTVSLPDVSACNTYKTSNGITFNKSGRHYQFVGKTWRGCDSIHTYKVTIYKTIKKAINLSGCNSIKSPSGKTLTQSGIYFDTLKTINGCDSVLSVNAKIYSSSNKSKSVSVCGNYYWPISNKTYYKTGSYTHQLKSQHGCDSTFKLNLIVISKSITTDKKVLCDKYKWLNGKTYTNSNRSDSIVYKNQFGCDSVIKLDLTINKSTYYTDKIKACSTITWINGKRYNTDNNSTQHILINQFGCDSVVSLDLEIEKLNAKIYIDSNQLISEQKTGNFQWIDCETSKPIANENSNSYKPKKGGEYQVAISKRHCKDTSNCLNFIPLSVSASSLPNTALKIYPSPNNGQFTIEAKRDFLSIEINELSGKLIAEFKAINSSKFVAEIKNYTGLCIVTVRFKNYTETRRILIEEK